jgi:hypothetical protein
MINTNFTYLCADILSIHRMETMHWNKECSLVYGQLYSFIQQGKTGSYV